MFLNCLICSLGQHFTDINIPLASKYARFVVLGRLMYWTPDQTIAPPPLLKSDDLLLRNQKIYWTAPFKNPGHAPENNYLFILVKNNIF